MARQEQQPIRNKDSFGRRAAIGLGLGAIFYNFAPEPVREAANEVVRAGISGWVEYPEKNKQSSGSRPKYIEVPNYISGQLAVESKPFLTQKNITSILERNNSPAIFSAHAFIEYGKEYGINPAIPLGMFYMESQMGTVGVARYTKSIGNLKYTGGTRFRNIEGFRGYSSWEEGIEDWHKLIREYYIDELGLDTIEKVVPVYAPSGDNNNESNYISTVRWCFNKWYDEFAA